MCGDTVIPDLKVGLEIHQQLSTGRKLFCGCGGAASGQPKNFTRRLRVSESETGGYDPAAIFEGARSRLMEYTSTPGCSCLVEEDEEPPHDMDHAARETALLIASALHSHIFKVLFIMRKIVIDGSNTSGFQRTALISSGGFLQVGENRVGVQSICLEEDAARPITGGQGVQRYNLDRLGVPLVEIALEPTTSGPKEVKDTALALGRLLRTTRRVSRGIGTIRQDVNVSVRGGNVVEIKGVQQLDQLEKIVKFEAERQDGLYQISRMVQDREITFATSSVSDVLCHSKSKIIQQSLKAGREIQAILVRNFAGLFGYEPYPGVRIGREIAQMVRTVGIGGVFHSDELPGYGISDDETRTIKERLGASQDDGFVILAVGPHQADSVSRMILERIRHTKNGTPAETRQATITGETTFLRPRPGAARMYPETDIEPIPVTPADLRKAQSGIPKPWDDLLSDLIKRHRLNPQLAKQVLDSPYLDIFEEISSKSVPPNFVASTLCSTITELQRKGLERSPGNEDILEIFELLASNKIPKESVGLILEDVMSGSSKTVSESVARLEIGTITEEKLDEILSEIVGGNQDMITKQGQRAAGPLMGIAMKRLRGKVPGNVVNSRLVDMIQNTLKEKGRG